MTPHLNGQCSRHSGDLNLVAALMSQGIPLDPSDPLSLIEGDHGNYASFRFADHSEDGTQPTESLLDHWDGRRLLPADHGFSQVCRFISSRPRGVQRSEDLLAFAVDYLRERGCGLPGLRTLDDVPQFVRALPHGEAAYVLAYVWNRDICFKLHRHAKRSVYQTVGEGRDMRHSLISTTLPAWQRDELLSRLQG